MSALRIIKDDPFADWESDVVQFRLTYEGPLLAQSSRGEKTPGRANNKHSIRKVFHKQLRLLWVTHPAFSKDEQGIESNGFMVSRGMEEEFFHSPTRLASRFERAGYRFVPAVTRTLGVMCGLEILFLRNDAPGAMISGGDIDNRLKTLLDGLTMPRDAGQLGDYKVPEPEEEPFYCLLEDDSLITKLSVEADTLLQPLGNTPNVTDARVVITVNLRPYLVTASNYGFG